MFLPALNLSRSWIIVIATIILLIPLLILELPLLEYSKGVFVYPQDEAYIRMAIGKNLALHGVWGLSGDQFNPASSSLLYPLLLAGCYKLFGIRSAIPFLINLLAAIVLVAGTDRWLRGRGVKPAGCLWILGAIILLTPIPVLVASGMEHMLQTLFTFLFLFSFTDWLEERSRVMPWMVFVWGILLTAARYEGIFLVFIACVMMLVRHKLLPCILLSIVSLCPLILFGWSSIAKGAYFFPTSMMMKALPMPFDMEHIRKFIKEDLVKRVFYPYNSYGNVAVYRIMILMPLIYFFLWKDDDRRRYNKMIIFSLAMSILHLCFANATLFYRYEGYLIAAAILAAGVVIISKGRSTLLWMGWERRWMTIWTCIILFYPFFARAWMAFSESSSFCVNTYEQDYQVGAFLHRYYNNATVVADNIGITSYLSDGVKIDLAGGIGFMDIVHSREDGYYRVEYAALIIQKEKPTLAVIAENNYAPDMLKHWKKAADWYINNAMYPKANHLSFYAIDTSSAALLKRNMQEYQSILPMGTKAVYP